MRLVTRGGADRLQSRFLICSFLSPEGHPWQSPFRSTSGHDLQSHHLRASALRPAFRIKWIGDCSERLTGDGSPYLFATSESVPDFQLSTL